MKRNKKFFTILRYTHALATIALAVFFIMKGYSRISEPKLRLKYITLENKEEVVNRIVEQQNYEAPFGYDITMNTFTQSGFLKFIGSLQILSGLLMLIPYTRFAGLLLLFPIILNIFLMHLFIDNRVYENIETGWLLAITSFLLLYYWKSILVILWRKPQHIKD